MVDNRLLFFLNPTSNIQTLRHFTISIEALGQLHSLVVSRNSLEVIFALGRLRALLNVMDETAHLAQLIALVKALNLNASLFDFWLLADLHSRAAEWTKKLSRVFEAH